MPSLGSFAPEEKNLGLYDPFAGTIPAIEVREVWRRHPEDPAGSGDRRKCRAEEAGRERSDKTRDHVAVMLHLRVRYVSKAAILTVPAPLVPAENRSPA